MTSAATSLGGVPSRRLVAGGGGRPYYLSCPSSGGSLDAGLPGGSRWTCPPERGGTGGGSACCLAERGSKADGTKYLPRTAKRVNVYGACGQAESAAELSGVGDAFLDTLSNFPTQRQGWIDQTPFEVVVLLVRCGVYIWCDSEKCPTFYKNSYAPEGEENHALHAELMRTEGGDVPRILPSHHGAGALEQAKAKAAGGVALQHGLLIGTWEHRRSETVLTIGRIRRELEFRGFPRALLTTAGITYAGRNKKSTFSGAAGGAGEGAPSLLPYSTEMGNARSKKLMIGGRHAGVLVFWQRGNITFAISWEVEQDAEGQRPQDSDEDMMSSDNSVGEDNDEEDHDLFDVSSLEAFLCVRNEASTSSDQPGHVSVLRGRVEPDSFAASLRVAAKLGVGDRFTKLDHLILQCGGPLSNELMASIAAKIENTLNLLPNPDPGTKPGAFRVKTEGEEKPLSVVWSSSEDRSHARQESRAGDIEGTDIQAILGFKEEQGGGGRAGRLFPGQAVKFITSWLCWRGYSPPKGPGASIRWRGFALRSC